MPDRDTSTKKDIYSKLDSISEKINDLTVNQAVLVSGVKTLTAEVTVRNERLTETTERVIKLETHFKILGWISGIAGSVIVGVLITIIGKGLGV